MPIDPGNIDVVCFDYGNTLIPFGPAQSRALAESLHADLERLFGPADAAQLEALCVEARLAPFIGASPSLREHRHEALLASIVETLYGAPGGAAQLDQLRIARYEHFCALIEVEQHVHETLGKLKARYRLGFLSNYPDAQAIRGSLQAHRLDSYFDHVVISGEVGYVKPHPVTFAQLLVPFGVPSRRVVYVGDNWLADVQGAKRVGMHAIQMRRWEGIEAWPENEGDHAPDAIIHHLGELEALLLP